MHMGVYPNAWEALPSLDVSLLPLHAIDTVVRAKCLILSSLAQVWAKPGVGEAEVPRTWLRTCISCV